MSAAPGMDRPLATTVGTRPQRAHPKATMATLNWATMIGVPAKLIRDHGAVSEEVAHAMAEGALLNSRAQVSLSITGVAGPTGGTPDKPVGMVCFGWSNRITTRTETQRFKGDRAQIRRQAAEHAMRGLIELIRNEA